MKPKRSNIRVIIDLFNSLESVSFTNESLFRAALQEKDMSLRSVQMITNLFLKSKYAQRNKTLGIYQKLRPIPTFASEELLRNYWYGSSYHKHVLMYYGKHIRNKRHLYPKAFEEFKTFYNNIPIGENFGWDEIATSGHKGFMFRTFMLVLFQRYMMTFEPPDEYTVLKHINNLVDDKLFMKIALTPKEGWEEWFIGIEKLDNQSGEE